MGVYKPSILHTFNVARNRNLLITFRGRPGYMFLIHRNVYAFDLIIQHLEFVLSK